jgi:hypothetical protein
MQPQRSLGASALSVPRSRRKVGYPPQVWRPAEGAKLRGPQSPDRHDPLPVRCAWCGRVYENGIWVAEELESAPRVHTHGICPDCFAELERRRAGG